MEAKKAQLWKELNWLQAGMPKTKGLVCKGVKFLLVMKKGIAAALALATLELKCSRAAFGQQTSCWGMNSRSG